MFPTIVTRSRLIAGFSIFVAWEVIELIWLKVSESKTKSLTNDEDSQCGVECDETVFIFSNYVCPTGHRSSSTCGAEFCPFSALHKLVILISASKSSLHICAYSLSLPAIVDAIIKVHKKRKILVKVIVEDQSGSPEGAQQLKKHGISVIDNTFSKGLMHLKTIVIDENLVITGSLNFTKTALIGQDNNFIITRNKGVVKSALDSFHVLWKANSELKSTVKRQRQSEEFV